MTSLPPVPAYGRYTASTLVKERMREPDMLAIGDTRTHTETAKAVVEEQNERLREARQAEQVCVSS